MSRRSWVFYLKNYWNGRKIVAQFFVLKTECKKKILIVWIFKQHSHNKHKPSSNTTTFKAIFSTSPRSWRTTTTAVRWTGGVSGWWCTRWCAAGCPSTTRTTRSCLSSSSWRTSASPGPSGPRVVPCSLVFWRKTRCKGQTLFCLFTLSNPKKPF